MINGINKFNAKGATTMKQQENVGIELTNIWTMTCLDSSGNVKWSETKKNLIVTEGLADRLVRLPLWIGNNETFDVVTEKVKKIVSE